MPIFEYKCNACGEDFEKLVFGDQKVTCTKCGSEDIRKKFSTFGMSGVQNPGSSGCSSCSSGSCSTCH
jgi:putative FmdB family regulatory protein